MCLVEQLMLLSMIMITTTTTLKTITRNYNNNNHDNNKLKMVVTINKMKKYEKSIQKYEPSNLVLLQTLTILAEIQWHWLGSLYICKDYR